MIVERVNNVIQVSFPNRMQAKRIQAILDYLRYEELTADSIATESDLEQILTEVKKGRWTRTKKELGIND